ncbi:sugar phosphate nucleotidyltransferase, partial [Paraburkholderia sp. SIMBA_050]
VPVSPETGYGYIRAGGTAVDGAYTLEKFVEKPHLELARHYVESGGYWWNSGIFVVRAAVWLRAVSQLQPEMYMQCRAAYEAGEAGEAG